MSGHAGFWGEFGARYPASSPRDSKAPLYSFLGPCRCQGCGTLVYWSHSHTRLSWNGEIAKGLLCWREAGGRRHRCGKAA